ncbi:MAG: VOC family protein [Anderseniella sp.]
MKPTAYSDECTSSVIIRYMSLNVVDFDKAVEWYHGKLGLEVEVSWKISALDGKQLAYLTLNGTRVLEIVAADANGTGLRGLKRAV